MGWTYTHRDKNQSLRQFFERSFWPRHEILDFATVNRSTCYILTKQKAYNHFGFHYPEQLFCAVVLVRFPSKSYYNFGYKDMDESEGPNESQCPERILKAIEPYPPVNQWAFDWRQRCWDNIKNRRARLKFAVGDMIELKERVVFTDGVERGKFRVVNTKPLRFADETGFRVRLSQYILNQTESYVYTPTAQKNSA